MEGRKEEYQGRKEGRKEGRKGEYQGRKDSQEGYTPSWT
jgi:hypothetical protein